MTANDLLQKAGGAAELIAALTGFLCWSKIKDSYWKYFPFYLLVIAVAENINLYIASWNGFMNACVFPYFIIPLEFIFFIWLFYMQFSSRWKKNSCFIFTAVYILSFIADEAYFKGSSYWFLSFSYSMGNIILLALIIIYLTGFAEGRDIIYFKVNIMFWVCMGLVLYYLVTFPFFGFINTLYEKYPELFTPYLRVTYILAILMYLLFTTGFLWAKRK